MTVVFAVAVAHVPTRQLWVIYGWRKGNNVATTWANSGKAFVFLQSADCYLSTSKCIYFFRTFSVGEITSDVYSEHIMHYA